MKRIIYLAFTALVTLGFVSCNKTDDEKSISGGDSSLTGIWAGDAELSPHYAIVTFNEDGTIEVIRNINTTITCDDSECPEIIYQKPNTKYNEYLFNGIFDNDDNLVDISKLEAQGSPYDDRYSNLTIKLTGLEDSIILTVDNEVSIIPKGMGNIPDAKTKASDVYKVTYDYNDGTNRKVTDNIVTRYTFEH